MNCSVMVESLDTEANLKPVLLQNFEYIRPNYVFLLKSIWLLETTTILNDTIQMLVLVHYEKDSIEEKCDMEKNSASFYNSKYLLQNDEKVLSIAVIYLLTIYILL